MPERTCLGCRSVRDKSSLVRLAKGYEGLLVLDLDGKLQGRGAYVCPNEGCLKEAIKKKAFGRALKADVRIPEFDSLREGMRRAGLEPDGHQ